MFSKKNRQTTPNAVDTSSGTNYPCAVQNYFIIEFDRGKGNREHIERGRKEKDEEKDKTSARGSAFHGHADGQKDWRTECSAAEEPGQKNGSFGAEKDFFPRTPLRTAIEGLGNQHGTQDDLSQRKQHGGEGQGIPEAPDESRHKAQCAIRHEPAT